ncbi:hypothetical protein ABB37_02086 [Leptomonas pyrrhocoris]|uniref:Uncharacterized protein n=1 Tax=Leptomonas pyrrhocoris TaxID=157538 RepID=A0A0N0DYB7_LEPPY|nr:hypothetical protein ABB37_02086 [Leptomonas pyrrhocoris]XP_015662351.1 hypothetical protein ABB37_02086 [Leptomonas pyrrhocoris]KPA83911.1 hypothetical protein ABB37_02086 [Leptomonas pyrrhocoris]KPA83912.1 hypothetical protein ABB37_02086 [Leptomonas pyrrhocoris]|eukprot:XP_015662350.1 hypothetical protein ABB37_02086 [Leptomonas pyrrhocoris]
MSDPEVDAYNTARCLFVQLRQAQEAGNRHIKGPPATTNASPHQESYSRLPTSIITAVAAGSPNPLSDRAVPSQHPNAAGRSSPCHANTAGGSTVPSAPQRTCSSTGEEMGLLPTPPSSLHASESSKKRWWRRGRSDVPPRPSSRTSSASAHRSNNSPREERGEDAASIGRSQDTAARDVQRWKDTIHDTLRQQSSALEKRLSVLLNTHVVAALAAAAPPPGLHSATRSLTGTAVQRSGSSPLPPISSASPSPSIVRESKKDGQQENCAEAVTVMNVETKRDHRRHCMPAALSPSPSLSAAFSFDLPVPLRVVAAGYAATIFLQTPAQENANAAGEQVHHRIEDARVDAAVTGHTKSSTLSNAAPAKRQQTGMLTGKTPQKAPRTLREQLQEWSVAATAKGTTPPSSITDKRHAVLADARVASLLSQLYCVQHASVSADITTASPATAIAANSPLLPNLPAPLAARDDGHAGVGEADAPMQCTVWEYVSRSAPSIPHAAFSAEQKALRPPDRQEGSNFTGPKTSHTTVAMLKAAWQCHRHSRRNDDDGRGKASHTRTHGSQDAVNGVDVPPAPCCPSSVFYGGRLRTADPLCGMSDGEWDVLQASVRATQQLRARVSKAVPPNDGSSTSPLCAFSPFCKQFRGAALAREHIVVSYSFPPCKLDALPAAATSAEPSWPALRLHTSWVVCVEVDAVHAAWLRRALLDAATTSLSPTTHGAASSLEGVRTEVVASLHLLDRVSW